MNPKKVSVGHIQYDFEGCIQDESDCYPQFYINVDKSLDEIQEFVIKRLLDRKEFDAGEGNKFAKVKNHYYEATLENKEYGFSTIIVDYSSNFTSGGEELDWTAIDLAIKPHKRFTLGDSVGNIRLYNGSLELEREINDAHAGEITSLKFFPSGEVLLSSSTDSRIKIWSLLDGSNPRTFVGHKSAVTDICMIDRGRNILSSSTDGTIRLWECGSAETIYSFTREENPHDGVNAIDIITSSDTHVTESTNPLEFGTEGKLVVAGHSSGVITLHDVFTKRQQLQLPSKFMSACNTIKVDLEDNNYVYAGYQNGLLAQWDLRQTSQEIDCISVNEGIPINKLYCDRNSMYVSSGLDSSIKFGINGPQRNLDVEIPTFLVSDDYQVSAYVSDPTDHGIITVGNWGFCAKYNA